MKLAKLVLTGSLLIGIASLAWAQQTLTGTVTTIDRISGTIAIAQTQSGTVGSSTGGAIEQQLKASDALLEKVHAGDKVAIKEVGIGDRCIDRTAPLREHTIDAGVYAGTHRRRGLVEGGVDFLLGRHRSLPDNL